MSASKSRSGAGKGGRGAKSRGGKGQGTNRSGGGPPKNARATTGTAKVPATPRPSDVAPPPADVSAPPGPGAGPRPSKTLGAAKAKSSKGGPRASRAVVHHIDPRSALRVSALFYLSLSLALFVAGALLWAGANAVGLVGNVEAFMDDIGFTDFRLRTGQFLKASLLLGTVLTLGGSLANLLLAVLYNLISETFGGIKVVLADDTDPPK